MDLLHIYLVVINLVAFAAMAVDKFKACTHRWRIPERTLILLAAVGGSVGSIAGMLIMWHKVRDKLFAVGLLVILAVHLLIAFAFNVLN
ncbi:MAG: DUF1294 domain-containing protein [Clostridia bacterium]|nr:DUF1294 domain-containing protein [Clostridia bacterium]